MEILTDLEAIATLEILKKYLTKAQKAIEDRNYEHARGMCYMPGVDLPFIIKYIQSKETYL